MVQVKPVKPKLKAAGTKRLKLQYDEALSSFPFKFKLRHCTMGQVLALEARGTMSGDSAFHHRLVTDLRGAHTLRTRLTHPVFGRAAQLFPFPATCCEAGVLRSFPGYLKWRSTLRKFALSSK